MLRMRRRLGSVPVRTPRHIASFCGSDSTTASLPAGARPQASIDGYPRRALAGIALEDPWSNDGMTGWVALLRGINVGGRHRVPMGELRAVAERLAYRDVATYVQSGNLVFTAGDEAVGIGTELQAALETRFGFGIPVVLRSREEIERIAARHPFEDRESDPARLHVFFLAGDPDAGKVASWHPERFAPDEVRIQGREVYAHLPNGMGRSKLTVELGTPATARNWRTVQAIRDLIASVDAG